MQFFAGIKPFLLVPLLLSACGPKIEVRELPNDIVPEGSYFLFSTDSIAQVRSQECPEGFEPLFPEEPLRFLQPNQRTVNLMFEFSDPDGLREARVSLLQYSGRITSPPDATTPTRNDELGELVYERVYSDPTGTGNRYTLLGATALPAGGSGGAEFYLSATDRYGFTRDAFFNIRPFDTACSSS